jgi:hypothetical protein
VMALFGKADGLVSSVFATILSYVYVRYVKRAAGGRGDPRFDFRRLVPDWGADEQPLSDSGGEADDRELEARIAGVAAEALQGERHDFRYDPQNQGRRSAPNRGNAPSPFQGTPRTLAP